MHIVVAFMAILAASLANGAWIYARLKNSHRELWESMGSPSFGNSNLSRTHRNFVAWTVRLKFLEISDTPLHIACFAALTMEAALVVLFITFLVAQ